MGERPGMPATGDRTSPRPGLGVVVLVTASCLLLSGAVIGWLLIGGDGRDSAASMRAVIGTVDRTEAPANEQHPGSEATNAPVPVPPPLSPPSSGSDESEDQRRDGPTEPEQRPDTGEARPSERSSDSGRSQPRVSVRTSEVEYGFAVGIRIVNDTDRPLTWTMRLTYDDVTLTGDWQARARQSGAEVTVDGRGPTATIPPGGQVLFGYHLTGQPQEPRTCRLNSEPCHLVDE